MLIFPLRLHIARVTDLRHSLEKSRIQRKFSFICPFSKTFETWKQDKGSSRLMMPFVGPRNRIGWPSHFSCFDSLTLLRNSKGFS